MIHWCSYCQRLLGEVPPLLRYDVSHGICQRCVVRLDAGEPLVAENQEIVRFFRDLFSAGRASDRRTCAHLVAQARMRGYGRLEVLVGLLQPALVEIGRQWERAEVTVADEHRFTTWCETMLELLDPPPPAVGPLDILLLVAPNNQHVLGPRFVEQVLLARGIAALCVPSELPIAEVLDLATQHGASWIGYSCALPHHVPAALDAIEQLIHRGYEGEFLLSGHALRRHPELAAGAPAQLVLTIDEAYDTIVEARRQRVHRFSES